MDTAGPPLFNEPLPPPVTVGGSARVRVPLCGRGPPSVGSPVSDGRAAAGRRQVPCRRPASVPGRASIRGRASVLSRAFVRGRWPPGRRRIGPRHKCGCSACGLRVPSPHAQCGPDDDAGRPRRPALTFPSTRPRGDPPPRAARRSVTRSPPGRTRPGRATSSTTVGSAGSWSCSSPTPSRAPGCRSGCRPVPPPGTPSRSTSGSWSAVPATNTSTRRRWASASCSNAPATSATSPRTCSRRCGSRPTTSSCSGRRSARTTRWCSPPAAAPTGSCRCASPSWAGCTAPSGPACSAGSPGCAPSR